MMLVRCWVVVLFVAALSIHVLFADATCTHTGPDGTVYDLSPLTGQGPFDGDYQIAGGGCCGQFTYYYQFCAPVQGSHCNEPAAVCQQVSGGWFATGGVTPTWTHDANGNVFLNYYDGSSALCGFPRESVFHFRQSCSVTQPVVYKIEEQPVCVYNFYMDMPCTLITCGPGHYKSSDGTTCEPCPEGTHNPNSGATSPSDCVPCPSGQVPNADASGCENPPCGTTPPTITLQSTDLYVSCTAQTDPSVLGYPSATDSTGQPVPVTYLEDIVEGGCVDSYSIVRTFTATDSCGNTASATQTIHVSDSSAPSITGQSSLTLSCELPRSPNNIGWPTILDDCDAAVTSGYSDAITAGPCTHNFTITRTFSANDDCSNSASFTQTVTVVDAVSPLASIQSASLTLQCSDSNHPNAIGWPTTSDNCDATPSTTYADAVTVSSNCPQQYSIARTFTVADDCGNSVQVSQSISVQDTTSPVMQLAQNHLQLDCTQPAHPDDVGWAVVTDNCDAAPTTTFSDVKTKVHCTGMHTLLRTFSSTDQCGNNAQIAQTIDVSNLHAPVISLANLEVTRQCHESLDVTSTGQATATQACNAPVTITHADEEIPGECNHEWTVHRTFTAVDQCKNSASLMQTINVIDTVSPMLSVADITIECTQPTAPSTTGYPTVSDNCDPAPTVTYTDVIIPGPCPATYQIKRTWTAVDHCGNSASITQTIQVQDTTPPAITVTNPQFCLWPPNHNRYCWVVGQTSTAFFAAADSCSTFNIDVASCVSNEPDPNNFEVDCSFDPVTRKLCVRAERLGIIPEGRTYTVGFTITDECGNQSTQDGTVYVPHDLNPALTCLRPNSPKY